MTFHPADSTLLGPLFADPEIAELYSEESFTGYLVAFEVALARVQGRLGVIPRASAQEIETLTAERLDFEALRRASLADGFPVIELLRQLRERLSDDAGDHLHRGATTQDVIDSATLLQLRGALGRLKPKLDRLVTNLAALARSHRTTLMAGRTHSQQALPITFGLKVAGWLAPLLRNRMRLAELEPRLLVLQFGGAAGTLAALGDTGDEVRRALARELGVGLPLTPWHSQRDNLAEFAGWLSLISGGLGKMAQDIILLAQSEVAEVRESDEAGRGGSSTMPQKSNPIQSELIVAAARSNATLLSSMHQALIQEHERGTHGWQLEWLTLPQMIANTSSALAKSLWLSENLQIDRTNMLRNVERSQGTIMAEAIVVELSRHMSRRKAKELVSNSVQQAGDRQLLDIVRERTDAPVDWDALADESNYLGSTQLFIDAVLAEAERVTRHPAGAEGHL